MLGRRVAFAALLLGIGANDESCDAPTAADEGSFARAQADEAAKAKAEAAKAEAEFLPFMPILRAKEAEDKENAHAAVEVQ